MPKYFNEIKEQIKYCWARNVATQQIQHPIYKGWSEKDIENLKSEITKAELKKLEKYLENKRNALENEASAIDQAFEEHNQQERLIK